MVFFSHPLPVELTLYFLGSTSPIMLVKTLSPITKVIQVATPAEAFHSWVTLNKLHVSWKFTLVLSGRRNGSVGLLALAVLQC